MNQENTKRFAAGIHGRGGRGLDLPAKQIVEKKAEKLLAAEEEGSMSPLPEKVVTFHCFFAVICICRCLNFLRSLIFLPSIYLLKPTY